MHSRCIIQARVCIAKINILRVVASILHLVFPILLSGFYFSSSERRWNERSGTYSMLRLLINSMHTHTAS